MKLLSSNLVSLASKLSDLKYHDGDSLGSCLGITRSAVWKAIKKLKKYGIEVISVKNKGYLLKEPLFLLDQNKISQSLSNPNLKIEVLETIDSSNNYLKKNIDNFDRRICFTEVQTGGRGRMGRTWYSPFGQNILMSYSYSFKKDVSELSGLSLVIGIACLNAIKEIGITLPISLKWPNDGVYNGQKLMGNLVELQSECFGRTIATIGIGINVNMTIDTQNINQDWTSLKKITGEEYIDRNHLSIALIHNLNFYLEQFAKYGLREFMSQWQELDYLYNKEIGLNNGEFFGKVKGVNENGNLLLELKTGETKVFSSGEATICKNNKNK